MNELNFKNIVTILVFGGIFVYFLQHSSPKIISYQAPGTQFEVESPLNSLPVSTTTVATATSTSVATETMTTTTKIVSKKAIAPIVVPPPAKVQNDPRPIPVTVSFESITDQVRSAVVNIICSTRSSGSFSPISGSGVVISPDGVIITNAHVAEYFLLKDFNNQTGFVDCVVRIGSPAYPAYKAELVYIAPQWVKDNADMIVSSNPTGTGEHDYAFLKITSRIDGQIMTSIPYLAPNILDNTDIGNNIFLSAYPAGFLGGISIVRDLYQSSAIAQVAGDFTFGDNTIDVISVPGTVVSQRGASGGAAVNAQGKLTGIISTSTSGDTTGSRDLRAITLAYINRDLITQSKVDLQTLITNATKIGANFRQEIAPSLTKLLTDTILAKQ